MTEYVKFADCRKVLEKMEKELYRDRNTARETKSYDMLHRIDTALAIYYELRNSFQTLPRVELDENNIEKSVFGIKEGIVCFPNSLYGAGTAVSPYYLEILRNYPDIDNHINTYLNNHENKEELIGEFLLCPLSIKEGNTLSVASIIIQEGCDKPKECDFQNSQINATLLLDRLDEIASGFPNSSVYLPYLQSIDGIPCGFNDKGWNEFCLQLKKLDLPNLYLIDVSTKEVTKTSTLPVKENKRPFLDFDRD